MLPSHIGGRAFIKTACKWWLVSVLIKIQPHVWYSGGSQSPPSLPPSPRLCLSVHKHALRHTCTQTSARTLPLSRPPCLCLARSHGSAEYRADLRGPYKWEGCKWRQKPETNHSTAVSRFLLNLFNWGEAAEQWKIYTHSILSERFWLILSDCQGWEYQGMDRNI